MSDWVFNEVRAADLQDARRVKSAARLINAMAQRPSGTIPRIAASPAEAHAAYRLLQTELRPEEEEGTPPTVGDRLLLGVHDACVGRVSGEKTVLAIQDTTHVKFASSPVRSDGDFWVHSTLAATTDGIPLGLLDQRNVQRSDEGGKRETRRDRPIEEKESYRWIEALRATNGRVPADVRVITVADREADIYELFAEPRPGNCELVVRACRDRCVSAFDDEDDAESSCSTHVDVDQDDSEPPCAKETTYLWPCLQEAPVAGVASVPLRRSPKRKARLAQLELRYRRVTLRPPQHGVHRALEPLTLWAVLATEIEPPDSEGISWLLLTTLSVSSAQEAYQCLQHYTQRWLIERFHFVLKSGCHIEDSQLRTSNRLQALLALCCIVAWRILWITYTAREAGDQPATVAFLNLEWRAAYCAVHPGQPPPKQTPTLREAVGWVAMLGGFLARRGDGEPGAKVLWQGQARLHDIVLGVLIVAPHLLDAANA